MARYRTVICVFIVVSIFLCLVVLTPVLLVLFPSPRNPSFSINLFHNQTFNMTTPNAHSLAIPFDLKLKNQNKAIGLHYPDQINITFSYFPNVSFPVVLAKYKLDSFYQGNGKTKHVRDMVETNGLPSVLEGTDMIAFRVDLVGSFRLKKPRRKTHKVELGCVVGVDTITRNKMKTTFIRLVEPGLDSKLMKKKESPADNYASPTSRPF